MEKNERVALFERELSYIKDENIKEFAKRIIEDADEYFFTVPASSSGKYHPDFARGEGGLVRHTKAVVFFTAEFCHIRVGGSLQEYQAHADDEQRKQVGIQCARLGTRHKQP